MIKLGVVMDPIQSIKIHKDSTFAMLLAAKARGMELYYMQLDDLAMDNGNAVARMCPLKVWDNAKKWFEFGPAQQHPLAHLDVVLMRKDPPFDTEYIYATYILERAEEAGAKVLNRASSLRNANEKLLTSWFPQCCPDSLVCRDEERIRNFLAQHRDIILKPLGTMGGASIFRVTENDPNISVIIETITSMGQHFVMAQKYIPEITQGDKRILLIDGEPVPYALARIPKEGETRANLAAGGSGHGIELTERDRWICEQLAPTLRKMGLVFVGIDVIGQYLTEINVTSPTCIRELDRQYGLDIAGSFLDSVTETL